MSLACIHQCLAEVKHQCIITFIQYFQQLLSTSTPRITEIHITNDVKIKMFESSELNCYMY